MTPQNSHATDAADISFVMGGVNAGDAVAVWGTGAQIWANVWQSNRIARIDPKTGRVKAWLNLTGILSPVEAQGTDVLNGIAYDAKGDRVFVTGKLWPKLFEIRVGAAN
mgnify:CR=1 FL=1